jgi:hypothetical protein
MTVYVLTSDIYYTQGLQDSSSQSRVVGVFDTYAAAEDYLRHFEDGLITEWHVTARTEQERDCHAQTISRVLSLVDAEKDRPTDYAPLLRDVRAILKESGWLEA